MTCAAAARRRGLRLKSASGPAARQRRDFRVDPPPGASLRRPTRPSTTCRQQTGPLGVATTTNDSCCRPRPQRAVDSRRSQPSCVVRLPRGACCRPPDNYLAALSPLPSKQSCPSDMHLYLGLLYAPSAAVGCHGSRSRVGRPFEAMRRGPVTRCVVASYFELLHIANSRARRRS